TATRAQWHCDNYGGAFERFRNYEFRASCAGTNIGGALATGSATLYQEGRREGSVWIMVLLSDGAAGGSNPITRIDGEDIYAPQPFNLVTAVGSNPDSPAQVYDPVPGDGGPISGPNSPGGYGIFGLCPYGLESDDPN